MNADQQQTPERESLVWKPLFDGVFEASSDGRIRRAVELAERYEVHPSTISLIRYGKTWQHVK